MANQGLPTPGAFVDDNLVNLYGETIDQLISDFGRNVTLYLPPIASGCPNCSQGFDGTSQGLLNASNPFPVGSPFNKSFADGGICPVCLGTHVIETEVTLIYKVSIQRSPKDIDYTQWGENFDPANVVKTKSKLVTFEDFRVARKALIDGDLYEPIRFPIKTGLRDLRYIQMWWMKLNK